MKIQGVQYIKPQTEYQYFPQEFFSGSDVTIYFGNRWIDDIATLGFELRETVQPIYGYNSYTYDGVSRGNRLIQGSFTIAYREAGYMYNVMENLAAAQFLATTPIPAPPGSNQIPSWVAHSTDEIQTLLHTTPSASSTNTTVAGAKEDAYRQFESNVWERETGGDNAVRRARPYFLSSSAQTLMRQTGFDIYIAYGPIADALQQGITSDRFTFNSTVEAIRGVQLTGVSKVLSPTGDAVMETYSFIARDID